PITFSASRLSAELPRDFFSPDWTAIPGLPTSQSSSDPKNSGSLWTRVKASIRRQSDQRRRHIQALQKDAERLSVQSTIIGADSAAVISGRVLHMGDSIDGFEVVRIEPRSVIVRKDGHRLTLHMP